MIGILADYEACSRVAYENVEDAYLEGIDYIELRFSPKFMAGPHGLDPAGIVESIIEGTNKAQRILPHGKQVEDRQGAPHAEVQQPQRAAMPNLRPAAERVSEVRDLSHLLSEPGR